VLVLAGVAVHVDGGVLVLLQGTLGFTGGGLTAGSYAKEPEIFINNKDIIKNIFKILFIIKI
jgi:hypothetical protein